MDLISGMVTSPSPIGDNNKDTNSDVKLPEQTLSERETEFLNVFSKISLFTNLVYQSAYLKSPSKPLSTVLISIAGSGKTVNLGKFYGEKHIYYTDIISPKFLIEFAKKVYHEEKKILVIPDFLSATEGNKVTRDNIIKILRGLIEEGMTDCSHYGYPEVHFNRPVKAGFITATTIDGISEFRHKWKNNGFLSRLIPFSYRWMDDSRAKIEEQIKKVQAFESNNILPIITKDMINKNPSDKIILPELMALKLDVMAYKLASITGDINAPFRQQIQLYTLAKAHCAMRRSSIVEDIDINAILSLSGFINLEFNKL